MKAADSIRDGEEHTPADPRAAGCQEEVCAGTSDLAGLQCHLHQEGPKPSFVKYDLALCISFKAFPKAA